MPLIFAALCLVLLISAPSAGAEPRLPLFDTHLHYSENAWSRFPPAEVFRRLDAAGVARAVVSSTPDDGTLELYERRADRVVPFLRPYRGQWGPSNWMRDPDLIAYLKTRLEAGVHRGIGEFHLFDATLVATPQVKAVVRLAAARDLMLHVHADAGPVRALFALEPELRILWAHAGMTEPPAVVGPMLDRYPNLWTEVSFRAGSIAAADGVDPAWRDLLVRHTDRIMVGTDTYTAGRWTSYEELVAAHRAWLSALPRAAAEAVAFRNAVRLFGDGGLGSLRD